MLKTQILVDPGEDPLVNLAGGSEEWLRYCTFRRPMSVISLFLIVLIFLLIQPAVQRRMVESRRLNAIRNLEQQRGSRVILLIHRQESIRHCR